MNSVAGGGTLLTFPALLSVVAPEVANATSTVALLPGSMAGAWGYRRELTEAREVRPNHALTKPHRRGPRRVASDRLQVTVSHACAVARSRRGNSLSHSAAVIEVDEKGGIRPDAEARPGPASFPAGVPVSGRRLWRLLRGGDRHPHAHCPWLHGRWRHPPDERGKNIFGVGHQFGIDRSVRGGAGYRFVWAYALPMVGSAIAGGYVGARVARKLPAAYVRWTVVLIGFGLAVYCFVMR